MLSGGHISVCPVFLRRQVWCAGIAATVNLSLKHDSRRFNRYTVYDSLVSGCRWPVLKPISHNPVFDRISTPGKSISRTRWRLTWDKLTHTLSASQIRLHWHWLPDPTPLHPYLWYSHPRPIVTGSVAITWVETTIVRLRFILDAWLHVRVINFRILLYCIG